MFNVSLERSATKENSVDPNCFTAILILLTIELPVGTVIVILLSRYSTASAVSPIACVSGYSYLLIGLHALNSLSSYPN